MYYLNILLVCVCMPIWTVWTFRPIISSEPYKWSQDTWNIVPSRQAGHLYPFHVNSFANSNVQARASSVEMEEKDDYEDYEDYGDQSLARTGGFTLRKKKKKYYKKLLLPLLLAYKLKFFTLVPVLIGGLVLLTGATGLAGFFFALFAAVMGLKTDHHH